LLARDPRGATEDVLELGHGFSRETLAMLALAGLAMVVTETLRANDATFKIERMRITGRRPAGARRVIEPGRRIHLTFSSLLRSARHFPSGPRVLGFGGNL